MTGAQRSDSQAGLQWRKSSLSGIGNCVEVASDRGEVLVRDSKDPTGPWMRYSQPEWAAFIRAAKNGEFDDLP